MAKLKIALIIEELAFDFIYHDNNYENSEELKNLLSRYDDIYLYKETNDEVCFKFPVNKFFKENKYMDLMNFIFNFKNELEKDPSIEPFIGKIKKHLNELNDINQDIINLFQKTFINNEIESIDYKDILKIDPYDFQTKQSSHCFTMKRLANFSSPGSGKTLTSMMAVLREYIDNKINNLVVIGPKSAKDAWLNKKEMQKFYKNNDKIKLFDFSNYGNNKEKINDIERNFQDGNTLNIMFINYHKLQTETGWYELLINIFKKPIGLIVDECHYFKNQGSQKFKKLMNLSMKANYVYFLSGTPLPRAINEGFYLTYGLWPIMGKDQKNILNKKISFDNFKNDKSNEDNFKKIYVRVDKKDYIEPLDVKRIEIPQNIVEKFIDNKLKENVFFNTIDINFNSSINRAILIRRMQAASSPHSLKTTLNDAINEMFEEDNSIDSNFENIQDIEKIDSVLEINNSTDKNIEKKMEKLISSSEVQKMIYEYKEDEDPRFIEMFNLLEKLNDKRVIIWNVFRKSTEQIVDFLRRKYNSNRIICKVDGTVSSNYDRTLAIKKIRKSTNGILIASPATIAESISLHKEIDHAIYFFRNYVGSHWMQSIDRIHRLVGMNEESRKKTVYLLISKNNSYNNLTIDELIDLNLNKKISLQNKLLDK